MPENDSTAWFLKNNLKKKKKNLCSQPSFPHRWTSVTFRCVYITLFYVWPLTCKELEWKSWVPDMSTSCHLLNPRSVALSSQRFWLSSKRSLNCLRWQLSLLTASALSLLYRSDCSSFLSNSIVNWSSCSCTSNSGTTGCAGVVHWRAVTSGSLNSSLVELLLFKATPIWKYGLMKCWCGAAASELSCSRKARNGMVLGMLEMFLFCTGDFQSA